jgi:hypothetical protein
MSDNVVPKWSRGLGASCALSVLVGVVLTVVLLAFEASGQSEESQLWQVFLVLLIPSYLAATVAVSVLGALVAGLVARWSTSWLVPASAFAGVVTGTVVVSAALGAPFFYKNALGETLIVVALVALGGGAVIGRFLLRLGRKPVRRAESPPAVPGSAA